MRYYMRNWSYSILLSICLMTPLFSAEPDPLKPFRWDYRIILVSAPADLVKDRIAELSKTKSAIEKRQILWFVLGGESIATNYTEPLPQSFDSDVVKRYFENSSKAQVRLIGKDGVVKEKASALDLKKFFARIDAMPMRRAEMRKVEKQGK